MIKAWTSFSKVQRACSVGGLNGSPTALAHQLPRVAGSTPGLETSQKTLTRRARTGQYRQHCDRRIHQPTRWSTLPSHVATRPPPPLESEASEVALRHSYSGLPQPDSRRAVTSCTPRRLETPSPDGPADLETFRSRTARPVRVPRDVSLPVVLLPERRNTRHGRTGTQLAAGPSQVCISPQWAFSHRHCARSGRKRSRSCSWRHTGPPGLGSQSWCSSWQPLPGRFLWGRIYWLRDGTPCGTRVQTSGNFMSGPWTGRGGSRWPTPKRESTPSLRREHCLRDMLTPWSWTCLLNGALLTEKTPGSARSESCSPFFSNGWSEGFLPPSLTHMWLRLLPTTTPWMGSWWGSMTGSSGSLGEREGWILHSPPPPLYTILGPVSSAQITTAGPIWAL